MRQEKLKLKPLKEQTVVITGASSGIGLATARMAAELGARVVLASRNSTVLRNLARDINKRGGQALAVRTDVSQLEEVETLADKALAEFGGIDTWINNAGLSIYGNLMDLPLADEKQLFEVNFWGLRHGCRVAVPILAKEGGALINLGSEVSARSVPIQGIYAASKHAVKAYTDALRMELEKKDVPVSVTLVRPTAINTPFPEHARNHLKRGAPSLPEPTYHPDVVAKAILACAEHPKRDAFVGGPAMLMALLETVAPRLIDFYMEAYMFREQSKGRREDHKESAESLHHVPASEGKKVGKTPGKMNTSSFYTDLTVGRPRASATKREPNRKAVH